MNLEDHQRMAAVHGDTGNLHLHIVANRVHPSKYTLNDSSFEYYKSQAAVRKIEEKYNLQQTKYKSDCTMLFGEEYFNRKG